MNDDIMWEIKKINIGGKENEKKTGIITKYCYGGRNVDSLRIRRRGEKNR